MKLIPGLLFKYTTILRHINSKSKFLPIKLPKCKFYESRNVAVSKMMSAIVSMCCAHQNKCQKVDLLCDSDSVEEEGAT